MKSAGEMGGGGGGGAAATVTAGGGGAAGAGRGSTRPVACSKAEMASAQPVKLSSGPHVQLDASQRAQRTTRRHEN